MAVMVLCYFNAAIGTTSLAKFLRGALYFLSWFFFFLEPKVVLFQPSISDEVW